MHTRKSRSMKDYANCVVKALKIKHTYYYIEQIRYKHIKGQPTDTWTTYTLEQDI